MPAASVKATDLPGRDLACREPVAVLDHAVDHVRRDALGQRQQRHLVVAARSDPFLLALQPIRNVAEPVGPGVGFRAGRRPKAARRAGAAGRQIDGRGLRILFGHLAFRSDAEVLADLSALHGSRAVVSK